MKAIPHGTFKVLVTNQVLRVTARGPFNKELIVEYRNAVNAAIEKLAGTKWAAVICLYGESLMTPEAEKLLVEAVKDRITKGMVATTSVFLDSQVSAIQHNQMSNIYKAAGAHFELFENENEAIIWAYHCLESL